jgi:hypothetical protein
MKRGYLVLAQGGYAHMAEKLAESIKRSQSNGLGLSIITDEPVDPTLFDRVIAIPDQDLAADQEWKIHNRVFFYDLTPYDETVILDADMLFLSDVGHWWKLFESYDLLLTNKVMTYRNTLIKNSPYRKTFRANQLPDVYSAFTYFKKSAIAEEFFKLVKNIVTHWDQWTIQFAPAHRQKFPSIDLAMSIAVKVLDIESITTTTLDFPTFTHMKTKCQGWKTIENDWASTVGVYKHKNGNIEIGSYQQTGILHYVNKDFHDSVLQS